MGQETAGNNAKGDRQRSVGNENLELKDFRCRRCKQPVAKTDGARLYAGGIALPLKVTCICLYCGGTFSWRPVVADVGRVNIPDKL